MSRTQYDILITCIGTLELLQILEAPMHNYWVDMLKDDTIRFPQYWNDAVSEAPLCLFNWTTKTHSSLPVDGITERGLFAHKLWPGVAPFSSAAWETMVPLEKLTKVRFMLYWSCFKQYYFTFTREKSKNEDKKGGLANVRLVNSPISIKEQHSELFYGNIPHSGWDSPEQGLQKVRQKFQINYGLTVN